MMSTSAMTRAASSPLTDDDLCRLLDAELEAGDAAKIEARLSQDPEALARLTRWKLQRQALTQLHGEALRQPVPSPLSQAAARLARADADIRAWRRHVALAASIVLAFGLGWLSHATWRGPTGDSLATGPRFARDAALAYVVYQPEVRHPVEVAAAEQDHLVQWLSKRLGRPLRVPQLGAQGFELVGGRLLPGAGGARAQFMYQDAQGTRLTLYIGAIDTAPAARGDTADETAFRFAREGAVGSFYWVDRGFGYALSGQLDRERLLRISQVVYTQL